MREYGNDPDRCALVEAAGRCFAKLGYERTTEAVIADCAGISADEFSASFDSREDAFHAVSAAVFDMFLEAQRIPVQPGADPRVVLAAATAAVIETVYSVGRLFTLIEARAVVDPVVREQLETAHDRILHRYIRFIEGLRRAGVATPCAESSRLASTLSDAQWSGAERLIGAPKDEQRRFIADMTAASERFIGLGGVTELISRSAS
ncbi:TetR/AcrR family transcriptional regulator [Rhodococcus marinonascens]|uniref:TetR/AcrR family transcriptional regulator n=1 Tax=Rhodococcus marinonascens TaxID=38311 RepID=UPI000B1C178F|nr:TetR/AcrR family transcriptional regulator [Rhodococcus marinonascens]